MPVGWIQPAFQATRMHTKSKMDSPTRNAKAVAMRLLAGSCGV